MTNRSNQQISSGDTIENKLFRELSMLLRLKNVVFTCDLSASSLLLSAALASIKNDE